MSYKEPFLNLLKQHLEPQPFINAMWEGGSAAFGKGDEHSDIDLQLDIEDNSAAQTFALIEQVVTQIAPISNVFEVPQPSWHGHFQRFYKFKDAPKFFMLDLVLIKHSSPNKFIEQEIHGDIIVLFDKKEVLKQRHIDIQNFKANVFRQLQLTKQRVDMFSMIIEKELLRGLYLDALGFYQTILLQPMLEVIRAYYNIFHYDFRWRYLYRELPSDMVQLIEQQASIQNIEDLKSKYPLTLKLYYEYYDKVVNT